MCILRGDHKGGAAHGFAGLLIAVHTNLLGDRGGTRFVIRSLCATEMQNDIARSPEACHRTEDMPTAREMGAGVRSM